MFAFYVREFAEDISAIYLRTSYFYQNNVPNSIHEEKSFVPVYDMVLLYSDHIRLFWCRAYARPKAKHINTVGPHFRQGPYILNKDGGIYRSSAQHGFSVTKPIIFVKNRFPGFSVIVNNCNNLSANKSNDALVVTFAGDTTRRSDLPSKTVITDHSASEHAGIESFKSSNVRELLKINPMHPNIHGKSATKSSENGRTVEWLVTKFKNEKRCDSEPNQGFIGKTVISDVDESYLNQLNDSPMYWLIPRTRVHNSSIFLPEIIRTGEEHSLREARTILEPQDCLQRAQGELDKIL